MDVSVIITLNSRNDRLQEIIKAVFSQKTDFLYEVICLRTSSSDKKVEQTNKCSYLDVPSNIATIGAIRNYAVLKSKGEYIVFLGHDSIPKEERWLDNLVRSAQNNQDTILSFGKIVPSDSNNPLCKRDMMYEQDQLGDKDQIVFIRDINPYVKNIDYRRRMTIFNINNTCFKKDILLKYPFDENDDIDARIWFQKRLEEGAKVSFCSQSIVSCSTEENLEQYKQICIDHFRGLFTVFGTTSFPSEEEMNLQIKEDKKEDVYYVLHSSEFKNKLSWTKYVDKRNKIKKEAYLEAIQNKTKKSENDNKLVKAYSNLEGDFVLSKFKFVLDRFYFSFPFNLEDFEVHKDDEKKIISWVIPAPGAGGGGTQTIMRFISKLEKMNFHNKIYLLDAGPFGSDEHLKNHLLQFYYTDCDDFEAHIDMKDMGFSHIVMATSWQTAYQVKRMNNCISKYYFVQDFEPNFYPVGSEYTLAERTYHFGFRGITAGDWLKNLLHNQYQMKTESFSFSYDKELYYPHPRTDTKKRVTFYARPNTARRAFEFGVLVLSELSRKIQNLEIIMVGADLKNYNLDFDYINLGIVPVDGLSEIYSNSDLVLVLSETNLSLLPLEIMASNSVAVCTKGPNSEWLVNEKNSVLVDYDIDEIVTTMEKYLEHKELLEDKKKDGLEFAKKTSWDMEAKKINTFLLQGLKEDEEEIALQYQMK